ncbi:flagellar hook-associated protein 3 [Bordetella genomosp. 9]|uniref:Flagellar hook-associated protein 3 n=1 Tax=Bordetella genomosp. 9 TaxID=1416803 RepID=A0A261R072_9BORD|nr:flagellar hook-associated protein FlgL [Bordetella genomosp. 9]OZI18424.1 flagellar hook-associated protein 3 [Bordetella genomosp. 9]
MIRLSTATIYQSGLNGILKNESDVNYLQQQLSSGRRVVTPSDDPLAAGQAITAYQNLNMAEAYGSNRDDANNSLGNESNTLSTVVSTLTDVLTRVVQAGNGTLADQDRNTLATVLEHARDALFALANTTDGNGQYLFSGTAGNAAAYVKDPTTGAVTYNGNSGQRVVQVEQSRQMNSSDVGSDIFNRATPGSTAYVASAGAGNTGTATFVTPSVASGGGSGNNFKIDFAADPVTGDMMYTVTTTDAATGATTTSTPAAYTPGDAIDTGGGVTMVVNGAPADGDSLSINTAGTPSYVAAPGATNAGTATSSQLTVAPGGASGNNFQIDFAKDAVTGDVTYTITTTDPASGTSTTTAPTAYTPGDAIDTGGGVSVVIDGNPEDGDSFTVNPTNSASVDMFATLGELITALKSPAQNDPAAQTKLVNLLATANKTLSINLDNVSTVQASVGARQNELDALDTTGTQRTLTLNKTLTDLTQINYYDAISNMSMRQLSLQASMSAFNAVKGTTLFSMNK